MPKRSNEFQKLVVLIQQALAPEGAVVTESALVENGCDGESREIDVLIETKVGEYRIKIAVEAKDEGRPMDSTKFESIIGKYLGEGGVKVNKIVIVTHRGFYQPVVHRAKKLDIDLLTLEEAEQVDWTMLRPPGWSFKSKIEIHNVQLRPAVEPSETALQKGRIVCSCGRQYGTPIQFATFLFWDVGVRCNRDQLEKFDNEAAASQTETKANIKIGKLSGDHRRYLDFEGQMHEIEEVSFDVCFSMAEVKPDPGNVTMRFCIAPHICKIQLIPPIADADPRDVAKAGRIVCACCSREYGTVAEWVHKRTSALFESNPKAQQLLANGVRESPTGHAFLGWSLPLCNHHRVFHMGKQHVVTEIKVQVHAVASSAPMALKQYELTAKEGSTKLVSHLEALVGGKKLSILMPDGMKSKRISMRIEDLKPYNA